MGKQEQKVSRAKRQPFGRHYYARRRPFFNNHVAGSLVPDSTRLRLALSWEVCLSQRKRDARDSIMTKRGGWRVNSSFWEGLLFLA